MICHLKLISCFSVVLFFTTSVWALRPLFDAYPTLKQNIPHVELTSNLPTPLIAMKQLGNFYNVPYLYCKDDGKTGTEFGGNKIRKLEFLLADAKVNKAKAVVTLGGAGSNHALATAVCAQELGLQAYLLLTPQELTQYTRRNLLMDLYFGATVEYFETREARNTRLLELLASKRIYYIPVGGSNELGAVGFVNAAFELKQQCDEREIAYPDYIYVAYGSYGTISGLLVGLKAAGLACKLVGVSTENDPEPEVARQVILQRACAINEYLCAFDRQFPTLEFSENDLEIRFSDCIYAQVTQETRDALAIMREKEQIQLDTTYSGKACAALLHDLAADESLHSKKILFWKTYADGEYETITKSMNYKDLPTALHRYFEEPLQPLDDQGC